MYPSIPVSFTIWDLVTGFLSILLILGFYFYKYNSQLKDKPYYKYLLSGLFVKLTGALGICFIYLYYYQGGDTINYYYSGEVMSRLFFENNDNFWLIIFNGEAASKYAYVFNPLIGYPSYLSDPNSFFVVKLITPVVMIAFRSFLAASLIMAAISYTGIWKLYSLLAEQYPKINRPLAFGILFLPSVCFWGSGILKDTITLSSVCWFVYALHLQATKKKFIVSSLFIMFITSYLILSIKPYIYYALIPAVAAYMLSFSLLIFRSGLLRIIVFPISLGIISLGAFYLLNSIGQNRGEHYSLDKVMDYAVVVQRDLKREDYNGSSFDIGEFDSNFSSMISKAPQAITAALFRPFIWEVKNPVMLFSALENIFITLLTILVLTRLRLVHFFRVSSQNPILSLCLVFSILLAFSVGLSTSNFGSLVRYKIPIMPLFVTNLVLAGYLHRKNQESESDAEGGD